MSQIEIREATSKDAGTIISFQLKMALETENMTLDESTVTKGVRAVFLDPSKGKYYVAEKDSELIACLLTMPEWSDWRNGTVLWIHSVYVDKKCRGQSVFKKMYHYLKQKVENSENLRGLRLYVNKQNKNAQKVYEALGMSEDHYHLYEWLK